ncbi:hypothetical protein YB2330_000885 [Saitoella coloradoensis]
MSNDESKAKAQTIIAEQFDLEILLKHRELQMIEDETAKVEVMIEQLKRATAPAPDAPNPYAQHYTPYLLPETRLSPAPYAEASVSARPQRASVIRGARATAAQKVCYTRRDNGTFVRLVCVDCGRGDFVNVQGFINHCRISHSREFASHDDAARICGIDVDENDVPANHPARTRPAHARPSVNAILEKSETARGVGTPPVAGRSQTQVKDEEDEDIDLVSDAGSAPAPSMGQKLVGQDHLGRSITPNTAAMAIRIDTLYQSNQTKYLIQLLEKKNVEYDVEAVIESLRQEKMKALLESTEAEVPEAGNGTDDDTSEDGDDDPDVRHETVVHTRPKSTRGLPRMSLFRPQSEPLPRTDSMLENEDVDIQADDNASSFLRPRRGKGKSKTRPSSAGKAPKKGRMLHGSHTPSHLRESTTFAAPEEEVSTEDIVGTSVAKRTWMPKEIAFGEDFLRSLPSRMSKKLTARSDSGEDEEMSSEHSQGEPAGEPNESAKPLEQTSEAIADGVDLLGGATRFHVKRRIVVGNVSKYLQRHERSPDNPKCTHKWLLYINAPAYSQPVSTFVRSVTLTLDPSFPPPHEVTLDRAAFRYLSQGWGDFTLKIRISFLDSRNKDINIVHPVKLDQHHTGKEVMSSESVFDVELNRDTHFPDGVVGSDVVPRIEDIDHAPMRPSTAGKNLAEIMASARASPVESDMEGDDAEELGRVGMKGLPYGEEPAVYCRLCGLMRNVYAAATPDEECSCRADEVIRSKEIRAGLWTTVDDVMEASVQEEDLMDVDNPQLTTDDLARLVEATDPQAIDTVWQVMKSLQLSGVKADNLLRDEVGGILETGEAFEQRVQAGSVLAQAARVFLKRLVRKALDELNKDQHARVNNGTGQDTDAMLVPMHIVRAIMENQEEEGFDFLTGAGMGKE